MRFLKKIVLGMAMTFLSSMEKRERDLQKSAFYDIQKNPIYRGISRPETQPDRQIALPPVKFDPEAEEKARRNAYDYMCRKKPECRIYDND